MDMLVKLYEIPSISKRLERLKKEGIIIRRVMPYEKKSIVSWVFREFDKEWPAWSSECDVSFSNHPASCFIATNAHKIIGFACYNSTCKGFFGPTGVAATSRGLGVGAALLLSCLKSMLTEGYAYAIIGGAGETVRNFYEHNVGAISIPGSEPGIYRDLLR